MVDKGWPAWPRDAGILHLISGVSRKFCILEMKIPACGTPRGGGLLFPLDTLLRSFYSTCGVFWNSTLKISKINTQGG
jgi:hypothetical protein